MRTLGSMSTMPPPISARPYMLFDIALVGVGVGIRDRVRVRVRVGVGARVG